MSSSSSELQQDPRTPTPTPTPTPPTQTQETSRHRVFVGNLTTENFDQDDLLRDFQAAHGKIEKIHFVPGKFAFVTFETAESAALALQDTRYDVRPARERGSSGGDNKEKTKNKKKKKKKRPTDARQPASEKICFDYMRGTCRHQHDEDNCRFSHDLPAFMKNRPTDIVEITTGCPNFNLRGHCRYGAMCRLGSCHIHAETGKNMRKDESCITTTTSTATKNILVEEDPSAPILPKAVQTQLRKRTYPFRCQPPAGSRSPTLTTTTTSTTSEKDSPPSSTTTASIMKTTATTLEEHPATIEYYDDSNRQSVPNTKLTDFENKIYVAPLTTVGNLPFRRIMKGYGADITCGEMALAGCLLQGNHSEWALLKRHASEDVFGVQLACAHADQCARACELIARHANVDFIDINMGCPIDLVCKKGAGAGLMMRERKLQDMLYEMSQTLSNTTTTTTTTAIDPSPADGGTIPITIKMRTGWEMDKPLAHRLVAKIQSWGYHQSVAAIMIHGRSRLQRYQQLANWDYVGQVAQQSQSSPDVPTIPIIGNGDIFSYTDYEEKVLARQDQGLSKTAMLGRGALIKPWLPTEIKERRHWDISASERLDMLKEYVRFGLEHWGSDQQGVNNTRRYMLEWLSFLHRYIPVGLLERSGTTTSTTTGVGEGLGLTNPQKMNERSTDPNICGRSDLEILFMSPRSEDWIKISELLLGPIPDDFEFEPKHKAKG